MYTVQSEPLDDGMRKLKTKRDHVGEAERDVTLAEDWGLNDGKDFHMLRVVGIHFPLTISTNTRKPAKRLVVVLSAARKAAGSGANELAAQVQRRDWDELYQCPILAISDPANEKDWNSEVIRTGMYMGNAEHDLVPDVNAVIDKFCDELDIPKDQVILTGGSVGGTAAALIAAQRQHGKALAVCAPTQMTRNRHIISAGLQVMGGQVDDFKRVNETAPWRFHPSKAVMHAREHGRKVRICYAQNVQDVPTFKKHFAPFCTDFGIDPHTGGISEEGDVAALLYDDWVGGHGFESKELSRPLWRRAVQYFETGT